MMICKNCGRIHIQSYEIKSEKQEDDTWCTEIEIRTDQHVWSFPIFGVLDDAIGLQVHNIALAFKVVHSHLKDAKKTLEFFDDLPPRELATVLNGQFTSNYQKQQNRNKELN